MGIVNSEDEVHEDLPHNWLRDPVVFPPQPKGTEILAHEFKDEADMGAVRTVVFKGVRHVANLAVSVFLWGEVAKMGENLPLKSIVAMTISVGAENFQSAKLGLWAITAQPDFVFSI